jgi:hypothetical protein
MTVRWRGLTRRTVPIALPALCALALWGAGAAHADLNAFTAVAAADAMRDNVTYPDAPLSSNVEDTGAPTAQSSVDGLGNSTAYAAFPYPGESALSGPGLASGVVKQSLPDYPLIVSSSDPLRPKQSLQQGPLDLSAQSTPTTSVGSATFGQGTEDNGVGRLSATASSTVAGPVLTAEAHSDAEVVTVAGVLRIGSVHAVAVARRAADGTISKRSELAVSQASVAGVGVEITAQGVVVAGQAQPVPTVGPVADALRSAGVTVTLVTPEETPSQIISGGVVITQTQDVGGQKAKHTYTFGRAVASVFALSGATVAGGQEAAPSATPTSSRPSKSPARAPAASSAPAAAAPQAVAGEPVAIIERPPAPAAATVAVPAATVDVAAVAPVAQLRPVDFARSETVEFYLILVLAGIVAVGGTQLIRTTAVRQTM